jgi:AraC-like DNA-binding protein
MHVTYEKLTVDENSLFHYQEFVQSRFTSGFHLHDEFELILIVKSYGKLYVGSNVANFKAGDLYFFAPGLPHCFYNEVNYENSHQKARAMVVLFKHDFLGKDFFDKTESALLKKFVNKSEKGIQITHPSKSLVRRIMSLNRKTHLNRISDLLLILNELASIREVKLLSIGNKVSSSSLYDSKIINDVFSYVAENFQQEISLDKAASVANMQKAAFCRYFKRKTKKTFTQIVNETRIMHAQKLLAETDKTVLEVAFECGYENVSYFNRQFRICCQSSPVAYRALVKQK